MPETKFLTVRNVEESVAREFSAGAAIRGITQAEYLKRLLALRTEAAFAAIMAARPDEDDANAAKQMRYLSGQLASLELWDMTA